MTEPLTLPATPPPLPVRPEQAVYAGLSTDHYPWTEVTVDLGARQGQGFSGVFDARQDGRWARFAWVRGSLLGGFTRGGTEVTWASTMLALPRARVTLAETSPALAQVIWVIRAATGRALAGRWPEPQGALQAGFFHGALTAGGHWSYWEAGRPVGGTLPTGGAVCAAFTPHTEERRAELEAFWVALLRRVNALLPLEPLWRPVILRLTDAHPCLDPFGGEVRLVGGELTLDPALTVAEFRPALHAALRGMLVRAGIRLGDLDLGELRARPEWAASGLETP